jgi:hypothetical protein
MGRSRSSAFRAAFHCALAFKSQNKAQSKPKHATRISEEALKPVTATTAMAAIGAQTGSALLRYLRSLS